MVREMNFFLNILMRDVWRRHYQYGGQLRSQIPYKYTSCQLLGKLNSFFEYLTRVLWSPRKLGTEYKVQLEPIRAQVVGDSPVHGPLCFPVNPVKLASPGPPHSQPPPPTPLSPGRDPPQHSDPQEHLASHAGQVEGEEGPLFFTVASDEEDRAFHDVSTLTDVCNSENVPEVEIISLLEERLPSYTLRADCLFGYEHDDWLHTPLLPPETGLQLTTEQIEETLKYFSRWILRAVRVERYGTP
ncbi:Trafficking kinesin-binding protein 1 [Acipenser ruthenus]|uniref:Trafficking kinesin-binding protein 1 n=1 Tax=Acipenser ruthenus TaxID=7906 RepID=A0A444ULP5_ACIRT|nr:Trafficking kinesin-binding protein 1 [Acipenser ruthenus]